MMNELLDLTGYLKVALACCAIGAILWPALRRLSTVAAIVLILVITILAPIPLFIIFALHAPPDFPASESERRSLIDLNFYSSTARPLPYERTQRSLGGDQLNIPNHLASHDRAGQIKLSYMREMGVADGNCVSISVDRPLSDKVVPSVTVAGLAASSVETCPSSATSMIERRAYAFQIFTPAQASIRIEIQLTRLMEFLKSLTDPWQAQIAVNSRLLTEDARGSEAWRNSREAPFLRPVTLSAENPSLDSSSLAIYLDKERVILNTIIYRPRTLSKEADFNLFWITFFFSLIFVSGAGWLFIERLWHRMRVNCE
jgi:hypothetical protein